MNDAERIAELERAVRRAAAFIVHVHNGVKPQITDEQMVIYLDNVSLRNGGTEEMYKNFVKENE